MFSILPDDINEEENENEAPLSYLKRIVFLKLGDLSKISSDMLLVSCDTIVVFENKVFHKPISKENAFLTLTFLNGKSHDVYSGCCIYKNGNFDFFYEKTLVNFKRLTNDQILSYINKSQPLDKAGSYGIQDSDSPVKSFKGSYNNVIGFPLISFLARNEKWKFAWK